jgi:phage virion morphogenesis protein
MGIQVKIDDEKVKRLLTKVQIKAKNLRSAFKSIGEYMIIEREKCFKEERDPEGNKWKPLKIKTLYSSFRGKKYTKKRKLNKKFQNFLSRRKILTKDGHLRRTVYKVGRGMVIVAPDKLSEDYAALHQFGGRTGRGHNATIPARVHLGINDDNRKEFVEIIKEHLLP